MLKEALAAYGLTGADAVLLGHNENLTYRVDGRYVLRIHQPKEGMSTAAFAGGCTPAALRQTELAFLRHLAGKGLHVQHPVPNLRGEDVTLLGSGVCATLLTWLEGKALSANDCTPDICRELGALAFRMHEAAQDFHPAAARKYDASHSRRLAGTISALPLTDADRTLLLQALAHIASMDESRADAALMIHADLNPSNVLATSAGFAPIDFSLGGMGHPMLDLAVLTATVPVQMIACCKAGYIAAGGVLDAAAYDAGFALGLIGAIALHGNVWAAADWFPQSMTRWRERIFLPLLEGRRLP